MIQHVLVLLLSYVASAALLTLGVHRVIRRRYDDVDLVKIAFEVASLLQFALWLPLGLGLVRLDPAYLNAIPVARELFDLIFIFGIVPAGFTEKYRKFILGHHTSSTVTRVVLAAIGYGLFEGAARQSFFELALLYYACSIFLVAPEATEKLLLARSAPMVRAVARAFYFAAARASHLVVFGATLALVATRLSPSISRPISLVVIVVVLVNEFHSVSSGWPIVRDRLRAARSPVLLHGV